MDQAAFEAESFTPAGPDTYGRFMRIRVMDMWIHEQDIREAVGRPGHHERRGAPSAALDEMTGALGFVVGKRAGAPAGQHGALRADRPGWHGRVDVEVGDRARVVDAIDGAAHRDAHRAGADHFMRLCGGRGADPAAVEVSGDGDLGAAVVANLGFMI